MTALDALASAIRIGMVAARLQSALSQFLLLPEAPSQEAEARCRSRSMLFVPTSQPLVSIGEF